jgi:hypothetical protein
LLPIRLGRGITNVNAPSDRHSESQLRQFHVLDSPVLEETVAKSAMNGAVHHAKQVGPTGGYWESLARNWKGKPSPNPSTVDIGTVAPPRARHSPDKPVRNRDLLAKLRNLAACSAHADGTIDTNSQRPKLIPGEPRPERENTSPEHRTLPVASIGLLSK